MCNIFFPLIHKFIEFEFDEQQRNVFLKTTHAQNARICKREKKRRIKRHISYAPYMTFLCDDHTKCAIQAKCKSLRFKFVMIHCDLCEMFVWPRAIRLFSFG